MLQQLHSINLMEHIVWKPDSCENSSGLLAYRTLGTPVSFQNVVSWEIFLSVQRFLLRSVRYPCWRRNPPRSWPRTWDPNFRGIKHSLKYERVHRYITSVCLCGLYEKKSLAIPKLSIKLNLPRLDSSFTSGQLACPVPIRMIAVGQKCSISSWYSLITILIPISSTPFLTSAKENLKNSGYLMVQKNP